MSLIGADRKWPTTLKPTAIDPERTSRQSKLLERVCEGVGHAREFRVSLALRRVQFNGMRRSRWLLALLLASQGFQKFFDQEGLIRTENLRRNRVDRLRSGVAVITAAGTFRPRAARRCLIVSNHPGSHVGL